MSVNITRARGDTYPLVFTIKSNGVPLDISGVLTMLLTVDPKKAPVDDVNNLFTLAGDVIDAAGRRRVVPDFGKPSRPRGELLL